MEIEMKKLFFLLFCLIILAAPFNSVNASDESPKEIIQAAQQGDAGAQRELGAMYYFGEGVPQDYKEAIKWYSKSAEQGTADAQGALGTLYYHGKGVPQDYKEAIKWYSKSAEQNYVKSQVMLGYMYYHGEGVQQEYVLAHMWFNLAAVQGNVNASELRDIAAEKMPPAQIEKAQKLAREWKALQNGS
jgi:TPR repeat protein